MPAGRSASHHRRRLTSTPMAPPGSDQPAAGSSAPPLEAQPSRDRACAPSATTNPGASVQFRALLVWQGTPAFVDVVVRTDGKRVAVVTARSDCRALASV